MVISQNDMDFYPDWEDIRDNQGDSCSIQWRISQVGCWTDWVYDPTAQIMEKNKKPKTLDIDPNEQFRMRWTIYEPCDTTICCARQLKVCRYDDSTVTIQDLGSLSDGVDCDTIFAYPPRTGLQCYNVCDFLKDFDELYPKIPESQDEIHQDTLCNTINNLIIISYNQSTFKILIENNQADDVNIEIYNMLGYPIISKSENIKTGLYVCELDISYLQNGIFVYNITLDGISARKGKMYIIK